MATTTTAAAFGGLSVPAANEDTMEMSSPAPQQLFDNNNDDFDIDFDDYAAAPNAAGGDNIGGGVHLSDDENMLEEDGDVAVATAPLQADEMMDDDGEQHQDLEETMEDDNDVVTVTASLVEDHEQDEELLDYGEEEDHGTGVQLNVVQTEFTDGQNGEAVVDHVTVDDALKITGEQASGEVDQEDDQLPPKSDIGDDEPSAEEAHEDNEESAVVGSTAVDVPSNAPATPTDTGLHPMEVRYGDMHMPLFKSRHQPDGLLKDDNLASLSLAELISSARQRLALKIGEDVSEDQELVLGFDRLGLLLVENSRPAFESSLNEILEVFLQLHYNDHIQEIPPLSLTFSLQLKFTSSLATLKQAAAGGQGISSFSFLASQAEEELYQGDDYGEEDADGYEYEGSEYHDQGDNQHDISGDATHGDVPGEAEQDDTARQQGELDEEAHEHVEDNIHFLEQQPEEYDAEDGEEANEDYGEENAAPHEASQKEDATTTALPGQSEGDNVESGAEKLTSSGEKIDSNPVGEYDDEDLIDWDTDDLIFDSSDNSGIGHSDLSTLLSEEQTDPTSLLTEPEAAGTASTGATHPERSAETAEHPYDASGESHENFEEAYFVTDNFVDEASYQEGYDPEEQLDDEFNATDTFGEQQYEEHLPADHLDHTENLLRTAGDILHEPTDDNQPTNDTYEQPDEIADTLPSSHPDVDDLVDFGDDLEYEDEANDLAVEPSNGLPEAKSGSPLGKRSFEEHIESDLFDDDEPDLKKVKPS